MSPTQSDECFELLSMCYYCRVHIIHSLINCYSIASNHMEVTQIMDQSLVVVERKCQGCTSSRVNELL